MSYTVYETYYSNMRHFLVGALPDLGVYADDGDEKWDPIKDRYIGPIAKIAPKSTAYGQVQAAKKLGDASLEQALQHTLNVRVMEIKRIAREGQIARVEKGVVGPAYARFAKLLETAKEDYKTLHKQYPELRFPWDDHDMIASCKDIVRFLLQEIQEIASQKRRSKNDELYMRVAQKVVDDLKMRLQLLGSPYDYTIAKPEVR